jgi:hypothetical protein
MAYGISRRVVTQVIKIVLEVKLGSDIDSHAMPTEDKVCAEILLDLPDKLINVLYQNVRKELRLNARYRTRICPATRICLPRRAYYS